MIDPRKVTDFNRSRNALEEFLLFTIIVAGKNAFQQAAKLEVLLSGLRWHTELQGDKWSPFAAIRQMDREDVLVRCLRIVKMGQYDRISAAFRGVAWCLKDFSLREIDISLLESIKGIGMKTSRFFAMHTRPNQEYACLDTHILKWLGDIGYIVPKTTPRGDKYRQLEQIFIQHARHLGKTPADLDLQIWNERHLPLDKPIK